jgi:hypothetical protein
MKSISWNFFDQKSKERGEYLEKPKKHISFLEIQYN